MFNIDVEEIEWGGQTLRLETGRMARQADGAVLATIGETCPFIIKGVMTIEDAQTAIDCGADAIVVSNHGGRVMDDGRSSIEVLESICNFVNGRLKVYTDGGYRSGYDVFKALALGADGVLIGRPFSHAAIGSGAEGVEVYTKTLIAELEDAMRMTGCQCLEDIKRNCVHSVF